MAFCGGSGVQDKQRHMNCPSQHVLGMMALDLGCVFHLTETAHSSGAINYINCDLGSTARLKRKSK